LAALLSAAIRMATPLMYAGLGEIYLERAGILNIGLEAVMLNGAFWGYAFTYETGSLFLGVIGGMIGGCVVSAIHAFFSVHLKKNQSISGIALNIFFLGLTSFFFKILFGFQRQPYISTFNQVKVPGLSDIPVIGNALFNQDIIVYVGYLLIIISGFLLNQTMWGISLTSIGENPRAADTVGIGVSRMQYFAAFINGSLGGIGGAYLTIVQLGVYAENITSGRGYMALAAVILGRRQPLGVFFASLFFGAADALQVRLQAVGIPLPSQLLTMLPHLLTIITLVVMMKRSTEPTALGKPYQRNQR
jgi:simple sugar transport system permease protein